MLALVESAPPVDAAACAEVVLEVELVLEFAVADGMTGVLVSVTPTLLQMACEYASAFARSEPEHVCSIQMVVLVTKGTLAQRHALSA